MEERVLQPHQEEIARLRKEHDAIKEEIIGNARAKAYAEDTSKLLNTMESDLRKQNLPISTLEIPTSLDATGTGVVLLDTRRTYLEQNDIYQKRKTSELMDEEDL